MNVVRAVAKAWVTRPISVCLLIALFVFSALQAGRAGMLVTSDQVPGPWGPVSNNFQLSISTTGTVFSTRGPIMVSVYLRNLGPETMFRTFDMPSEYWIVCKSKTTADGCTRRPSFLGAHNIGHGGFVLRDKDETYVVTTDIADMYDIKPGTYQVQVEFPVIRTSTATFDSSDKQIADPISNAIEIKVVNP
jgi:hypothetical protein